MTLFRRWIFPDYFMAMALIQCIQQEASECVRTSRKNGSSISSSTAMHLLQNHNDIFAWICNLGLVEIRSFWHLLPKSVYIFRIALPENIISMWMVLHFVLLSSYLPPSQRSSSPHSHRGFQIFKPKVVEHKHDRMSERKRENGREWETRMNGQKLFV